MSLHLYVLRRLLYIIPILLGVCLIIFFLFNFLAGDPTQVLLGKHATLEQMAELRHELGLDRPWYMQYLDIVRSAFTFDFGRSWSTKQDIWEMIKLGAGPSSALSFPAFFTGSGIAISMSLLVAFFRGKFIDRFSVILSIALISFPSLAIILFGQYYLAYSWGIFEISGYEAGFPNCIPYLALPFLMWVIMEIGGDLRFFRTVMLDEIYQDYVRTARSKGLSEVKILFKHVLKNAMIPILSYTVIHIPFLITGALLLESFFGIPGLGGLTIQAINSNDFPVIKAMTILSSIMFIVFSVLTDVLYTLVDPRVRLK